MPETVNILDALGGDDEPTFERASLNENETALIFFTQKGERTTLHYCDEPEIHDSVLCLGSDCLLCRIGRKRDQRILLPVYLPLSRCVAVLTVSTSLRPNALLPQIGPILTAGKPMVAFVTRHYSKFTVSTAELSQDTDAGEATIEKFLKESETKKLQLSAVYQRLENEQLSAVSGIAEMARLKGIQV